MLSQSLARRDQIAMSALPPIADIPGRNLNVRFVPKADITTAGTGIYLHRQNIAEAHTMFAE